MGENLEKKSGELDIGKIKELIIRCEIIAFKFGNPRYDEKLNLKNLSQSSNIRYLFEGRGLVIDSESKRLDVYFKGKQVLYANEAGEPTRHEIHEIIKRKILPYKPKFLGDIPNSKICFLLSYNEGSWREVIEELTANLKS